MSKRVSDGGGDNAIFKVVVSREGRYSIWPADRENARGWKDAGKTGTRLACQRFIDKAEKEGAGKRV